MEEEILLLDVASQWDLYCNSTVKPNRWLKQGLTPIPSLQKKPSRGSRSDPRASPFWAANQWMFPRRVGYSFVDKPIILLPQLCSRVVREWHHKSEPRGTPRAFAIMFNSQYEGARRDDIEWIVNQALQSQQHWETCQSIDQYQSHLLRHHPRRKELLQTFSQRSNKRSSLFTDTMKDCLEADPPSCYGTTKSYQHVNNIALASLLSKAQQTQTFLLRDLAWSTSLPVETSDLLISNLPNDSTRLVDVKYLGVPISRDDFQQITTRELKSRWQECQGRVTSSPINLLNISGGTLQTTPPPLVTYCDLLRKACDGVLEETIEVHLGKKTTQILEVELKKGDDGSVYTEVSTSTQNCQRFLICGQAGAISGWHMDLNAPITFVTIEGGDDVLKYWSIIDFESMTEDECCIAKRDFAKQGANWMPERKWIKTFSLLGGYALIMRLGTIHAPITATNCLARGGMVMDKRFFVSEHLVWWKYIAKNRSTVTNEEPSKQTPSILKWIMIDIKNNPDQYKVKSEQIPNVIADCQEVIADSKECDCNGACFEGACYCHFRGLFCILSCGCGVSWLRAGAFCEGNLH